MLTPEQHEILAQSKLQLSAETEKQLTESANNNECSNLSDEQLLQCLQITNALYRAGEPVVTDEVYDHVLLAELRRRNPQHSWLHQVEPEPEAAFSGKTVNLPVKMLSTEKAYNLDAIGNWLKRIEKASAELDQDFSTLKFRMTPKLDGYAAYDDGEHLYTRGDGRRGTDITRVFQRGLVVAGNGIRGQGAGEVVICRSYFKAHLADFFDNARNFQASIIKEKELNQHALQAIQQKAAVFFPFAQLPSREVSAAEILTGFADLVSQVPDWVDYDVDGVVFEVTDARLKQAMGATRHHHRWQIAYKTNAETMEVRVLQVLPQTSRSGRVNPVAVLEPVRLSGALISRATAHHYGMVKAQGIGPGTVIELTRSGLVIPKIVRVIIAKPPQIPEQCPSCGHSLVWDSDYLYCMNTALCPAQIENSIEHFFKTLGNVDGFGNKTIEKLHQNGVDSIFQVYQLTVQILKEMGFGDKTAHNLLAQLIRSRTEAIEDWRFLGAFGIDRMGLGNCERLLQHYPLERIFSLSLNDLCAVEGFAEKMAAAVVDSLATIQDEFKRIYQLGFNLIMTPLISGQSENLSAISGKQLVFTGTMRYGNRSAMKKQAKLLGAKVAASVTGKTDFLVAGEKGGSAKIKAAREKGVAVLSEEQYLAMINTEI